MFNRATEIALKNHSVVPTFNGLPYSAVVLFFCFATYVATQNLPVALSVAGSVYLTFQLLTIF